MLSTICMLWASRFRIQASTHQLESEKTKKLSAEWSSLRTWLLRNILVTWVWMNQLTIVNKKIRKSILVKLPPHPLLSSLCTQWASVQDSNPGLHPLCHHQGPSHRLLQMSSFAVPPSWASATFWRLLTAPPVPTWSGFTPGPITLTRSRNSGNLRRSSSTRVSRAHRSWGCGFES